MRLDFALRHNHVNPVQVEMHSHSALELVYYTKGRGVTIVNGTAYPFRPGFFAVVPAGIAHDQQDNGPVTSLCFGVVESGLETLSGGWQDQDGSLRIVCEALLHELAHPQPGAEEITQGLLLQMVGLIRRSAHPGTSAPERGRKKELVKQAETIIRNRGGMVTVSELSQELYVSHDYLRHLFQEQGGESPMRRIIRARLERAKELLATSALPLAEVAARSGFDSPYYFSRLFKQIFGLTPSAFRRQNAGTE